MFSFLFLRLLALRRRFYFCSQSEVLASILLLLWHSLCCAWLLVFSSSALLLACATAQEHDEWKQQHDFLFQLVSPSSSGPMRWHIFREDDDVFQWIIIICSALKTVMLSWHQITVLSHASRSVLMLLLMMWCDAESMIASHGALCLACLAGWLDCRCCLFFHNHSFNFFSQLRRSGESNYPLIQW